MPILVHYDESKSLRRRLSEINAGLAPNSGKVNALKGRLREAIEDDNREKLLGYGSSALAGVDRYGKDLVTPADSTIRGWGHLGRVLAPNGLGSRTITRFRVIWARAGDGWRLVAGWVGVPWMLYHLRGCRIGSNTRRPNWQLPQRDIGGVSPKGWVKVRAAFADFRASLLTKGQ